MRRYLSLRLLQMIPVLIGVTTVVFLLVRLIPGDPATSMLGSRATPELIGRVRQQFGLDLPIWRQYVDYLGNVVRGNFGVSFFYQTSVSSIVSDRPYSDARSRVVRPVTYTVAPAAPSSTAIPRPAPRVAPATKATFPSKALSSIVTPLLTSSFITVYSVIY